MRSFPPPPPRYMQFYLEHYVRTTKEKKVMAVHLLMEDRDVACVLQL